MVQRGAPKVLWAWRSSVACHQQQTSVPALCSCSPQKGPPTKTLLHVVEQDFSILLLRAQSCQHYSLSLVQGQRPQHIRPVLLGILQEGSDNISVARQQGHPCYHTLCRDMGLLRQARNDNLTAGAQQHHWQPGGFTDVKISAMGPCWPELC